MGVSQNEAAGTGSLSQGFVSRVCFVVCFAGLFRTVLLPRTVKFKGSVSGSVSKVCFGVCFGGLFRQSRTYQPYLKLHSPKKCKPIYIYKWYISGIYCQLGGYMPPTTFCGNQKQPLILVLKPSDHISQTKFMNLEVWNEKTCHY